MNNPFDGLDFDDEESLKDLLNKIAQTPEIKEVLAHIEVQAKADQISHDISTRVIDLVTNHGEAIAVFLKHQMLCLHLAATSSAKNKTDLSYSFGLLFALGYGVGAGLFEIPAEWIEVNEDLYNLAKEKFGAERLEEMIEEARDELH